MMRYNETPQFRAIEHSIVLTASRFGLVACSAKDHSYSDQLWDNVRSFHACLPSRGGSVRRD
jgi:hypothetical protein